jgi:hypothetical protein
LIAVIIIIIFYFIKAMDAVNTSRDISLAENLLRYFVDDLPDPRERSGLFHLGNLSDS